MGIAETQEASLPLKTTLAATDKIRVIVGGISAGMYPEAFAGQIEDYLSPLTNRRKIRAVTSTETLTTTDSTILASGTITLTLPPPAQSYSALNLGGQEISIVQISTSGTISIVTNDGEALIEDGTNAGSNTITLTSGDSVTIQTNGTNWYVKHRG